MTQQHPITPPQWQMDAWQARIETMGADVPAILLEAAQWGSNQELEACLGVMNEWGHIHNSYGGELADDLRAARRPKPLTLKQKAQRNLANMIKNGHLSPDLAELFTAAVEMAPDE